MGDAPTFPRAVPSVRATAAPRPRRRAARPWPAWALIAAVSYVPLMLTKPGMVAADTKQYLYLDPRRLTVGAASMWDPNVGMGTVTHQNIGFLFPMGPYYWLVQALHVPMWVGQRIWMGTLLAAAGLGVLYLCRQLGVTGPGRVVAALAYTLTPYIIDYIGRISVILMPWAALGWMTALVILAARRGGWRYPALFALVLALVGGVNATSVVLAGLAPLLWLLQAVCITHEVTLRRAAAAVGRIALLSVGVSLWWIAGLWAEGSYGIAILQYTETLQTVDTTSLASEALRGLGYWYFYGQDKVQPWTQAAVGYMQWLWLIALSFAVPVVSVVAGVVTRWRYRAFAVALVVVGTVVAVGAYPYDNPSPFGSAVKAASTGSIGLAMRSSDRVVPLIALGLALLLGSGVDALAARRPRWGLLSAAVAGGLVMANLPPLWTGGLVASNLQRPSSLPQYWLQAAAYLNAQGDSSRVLGIPGEDFAAYRWGVTQDPVAPGLLTRPYVSRQVVPQGEPASVDLAQALDESIQDGVFDPATLAPLARLMSVGSVLVQSDLQYERYVLPHPQALWAQLNPTPAGLSPPKAFGTPAPTKPIKYPQIDETQLGLAQPNTYPPPLAVFNVGNPRPIVRAEPTSRPLVVAGDSQGLLAAAPTGLLDGDPAVFYSASFAQNPAGLQRLLGDGADLVVTDTNRLQGRRWGSLQANLGYVQQAGETPLKADPSNAPLPVFPGAPNSTRTVAELSGVQSVRATSYGNPITYSPEDRPYNAVDGDPSTAWTEGAFSKATNETLEIRLNKPVTTDHLTLLQAGGFRNRWITHATISFDGRDARQVTLGASSRSQPGQVVTFPSRTFQRVDVTVDATTAGARRTYDGLSSVGFAEVGIPGINLTDTLQLPTDLLSQAGTSSLSHRLVLLMNRFRGPDVPPRTDPEHDMLRAFDLPTARTFTVGGAARIAKGDSDNQINGLLGVTGGTAATGGATIVGADSSTRLPGDLRATADAAVDGNPATAWTAALGTQSGEWVEYRLDRTVTLNHLDLQVVTDGRHSVPTRITISTPSGSRTVDLPALPVGKGRPQGSVTPVTVSFPALTGSQVRLTIDAAHEVTSLDYQAGFSGNRDILPMSLAEVGMAGVTGPSVPSGLPGTCRSDLLSVDGRPVDVAVTGSTADALDRRALTLTGCGNAAGGLTLGPGRHVVTTAQDLGVGIDVDSLMLGSERGGGPLSLTPQGTVPVPAPSGPPAPKVTVTHQDRTHVTATVHGTGQPSWLVLGQSLSRGWQATLQGGHSLGAPQLVDGYANGWLLPAIPAGSTAVVHLAWTPQRVVWVSIVLSAAALLACIALAIAPAVRRRRRRRGAAAVDAAPVDASSLDAPWVDTPPLEAPSEEAPWAEAPRAEATSPEATPAEAPSMEAPWAGGLRRPRAVVVAGAAVAAGLVAGAVTSAVGGLVIAALVAAALVVPRGRVLTAVAAAGLLGATGVYMVSAQSMHHWLPVIQWPTYFGVANTLAWLSVCALGADALVSTLRRRSP